MFVENLPKFVREFKLSLIKQWFIRSTISPFHVKVTFTIISLTSELIHALLIFVWEL